MADPPLTHVAVDRRIEIAPAALFAVLEDLPRHRDFLPRRAYSRFEMVGGVRTGPGAAYWVTSATGRRTVRCRLTVDAVERPRRLVLRTSGGPLTFGLEYAVAPLDDGDASLVTITTRYPRPRSRMSRWFDANTLQPLLAAQHELTLDELATLVTPGRASDRTRGR